MFSLAILSLMVARDEDPTCYRAVPVMSGVLLSASASIFIVFGKIGCVEANISNLARCALARRGRPMTEGQSPKWSASASRRNQ